MNLESIAKYFAPKSPILSDSPRATASDGLTGTDIMAALGLVNAKCGFGFDLYLAKIGVSTPDRAMELLYETAERLSIRFNIVSELSQDVRKRVLEVLCAFAYQDYTRSAASVRKCSCCDGTGFTEAQVFTNKCSYPWGKPPYWAKRSRAVRPSDWEKWTEVTTIVNGKCEACDGKGKINARCRCGGSGQVLDRKATKEQGAPVYKTCERCSGNGFSTTPSTAAYKAILTFIPDLHVRTWTRNWKPFCDTLVDVCWQEERHADKEFQKATNF